MIRRRSSIFIFYMTVNVLLLCLMFLHSFYSQKADAQLLAQRRALVGQLGLSDLCLFTDARYTRHPSVADLNTPFQDYPMSFEHFPSGSILSLPPHLSVRDSR
jgi:hypothetical protein